METTVEKPEEEVLENEATPQVEEPEQQEEEVAAPEVLDSDIRLAAQQYNMSDADIDALYEKGGQEAVWAAVMATHKAVNMNQGGEREPAKEVESESPPKLEMDLEGLDSDDPFRSIAEKFNKSANDVLAAQHDRIQQLEQALGSFAHNQQSVQAEQTFAELDTAFSEIDPARFGSGRINQVTSQQAAARQKLADEVFALQQVNPGKSVGELVRRLVGPATTNIGVAKKRQKQIQGGESGGSTEDTIDSIIARVQGNMASRG